LCGGKLDFTEVLRNQAARGGYTTVNIPLSCLREAGTDLSDVSTGFSLTATKALTLTLQSVKVSHDGEVLACAAVPPVSAAAAMLGPGHAADTWHGDRKSSVHGLKKKKAGGTHVGKSGKKRAVHSSGKSFRKRKR
jgi:beta-glucosidase